MTSTTHISDEAREFMPKGRAADNWRGLQPELCTHQNIGFNNFIPLATDGELCVVKDAYTNNLFTIKLANIVWPTKAREQKPAKPKTNVAPKKQSATARALAQLDAKLAELDAKLAQFLPPP